MTDIRDVLAPYNFIPFSDQILVRYADASQLPGHDTFGGNEKNGEALKTGEIHVTFTAETPVFVSDGEKEHPHFYRGANGKYMIPGSTVRGMLRENMQILGFGLVRKGEDLDDYEMFFRNIAGGKRTVGYEVKTHYTNVLSIVSGSSRSGKQFSIARNVKAGYLYKDGDSYFIQPTEETFMQVRPNDEGEDGNILLRDFRCDPASVEDAYYKFDGRRLKRLSPKEKPDAKMRRGKVLFTGKVFNNGGKPNAYLFPQENCGVKPIPISEADALAYQIDWENRVNNLKGGKYDPNFWALPKNSERKPVFFAQYDGHTYFGMSKYIRIGFGHTIAEGLPENHRKLAEDAELVLDYPHALLGFAGGKQSYRSRVSVGDFEAERGAKQIAPVSLVFSSPKPSFYPAYVSDGGNYAKDGFRLRGYKQYWLKEPGTGTATANRNLPPEMRPMAAGTRFEGVI